MINKIKKLYVYPGLYFNRKSEALRAIYQKSRKVFAGKEYKQRKAIASKISSSLISIPREKGFTILKPPHSFPEISQIREFALQKVGLITKTNQQNPDKEFMHTKILDMNSLLLESPFLKFALNENIIKAISQYLGVVPLLSYINIWHSKPNPSKPLTSSQLLHCDHADTQQIKVFIYCHDVDEKSGPLTFFDASTSERLKKAVKYSFQKENYRVSDETAKNIIGLDHLISMTGPEETIGFVDTCRCFHFGSRIQDENRFRIVVAFQYLTPFSFVLSRKYDNLPFSHLSSNHLSPLQKMVLGRI